MNSRQFLFYVVALLAISGFQYVSAQPSNNTKTNMHELLPTHEGLAHLTPVDEPYQFTPSNLWEHINGAAELFIGYDFEELLVAYYVTKDSACDLTVELYRMKSPLHAFGIFAAERSPDDVEVNVAVQGYKSPNILNFWKNSYYIKLSSFQLNDSAACSLLYLAEHISQKISDDFAIPALFNAFPVANKIRLSERFIPHNFLGHPFLHGGYTVNYALEDKQLKLYLIDLLSLEAAQNAFNKYITFLRENYTLKSIKKDINYELLQYEENLVFIFGHFLGGTIGEGGAEHKIELLQELVENVKKLE